MGRRRPAPDVRLVVDPIACDGIGLCSQLADRVVALDRWGFPIVGDGILSGREAHAAARAVRGCPRRALAIILAADGRG